MTQNTTKTAKTTSKDSTNSTKDSKHTKDSTNSTKDSNNYNIIVITDSGCEEAAQIEILRWLPKADIAVTEHEVRLAGTIQNAALLGYRLQTARRVMIELLPRIQKKQLDKIDSYEFPAHIKAAVFKPETTFKVEAEVLEMHPNWDISYSKKPLSEKMSAHEIIDEVGGWAFKTLKQKVDLKRPDVVIAAIANKDMITIGIDMIGSPLAKREYRIMLNSQRGIKSTIAAATIIYADALKGIVLDPMPGDGIFCIEAALLRTKTSPRKYQRIFSCAKFPALEGDLDWRSDKEKIVDRNIMAYASSMKEMKAVRTNSKLANCDDAILSTKVSIDWMDIKLDPKSVDCIVTAPPCSGRSLFAKDALKIQDMLFNQAEYILKNKGSVTCIVEKPIEIIDVAKKYKLVVEKERVIYMGMREMTIVTFKKNLNKE